jgi:hypothetical protein
VGSGAFGFRRDGRQERGDRLATTIRVKAAGQVLQDVTALLATGRHHRQHPLHEPTLLPRSVYGRITHTPKLRVLRSSPIPCATRSQTALTRSRENRAAWPALTSSGAPSKMLFVLYIPRFAPDLAILGGSRAVGRDGRQSGDSGPAARTRPGCLALAHFVWCATRNTINTIYFPFRARSCDPGRLACCGKEETPERIRHGSDTSAGTRTATPGTQ